MGDDLDDVPYSSPLRLVTPHKSRALSSVDHLRAELKKSHSETNSWRETARVCKVVTASGFPDPGMAFRISVRGYDPKRPETRERLGLPPVCGICGQKVKRVRVVPAWVERGVEFLASREKNMTTKPTKEHAEDQIRVYARGGKPA